jgi:hypothetical protein
MPAAILSYSAYLNAIASMIRKHPTENITIAANASQPDGSSPAYTWSLSDTRV